MRWPASALLLTASFLATACADPTTRESEVAVRTAITNFRTSLNTGDTATFFRLTAEDLELFPPGAAPLRGAAARDFLRGLFVQFTPSLEPFQDEELQVSRDWAM
jgi:ketosteroid isomerase-like protein